ncbi:MAG TPA: hypothetical protein PLA68_04150 [Panacibacter sp.]|nr:hypothetical protein [Panacibacter sp.]
MKKLCLLLILSVVFFSCGKNDNGRYTSMGDGILDTQSGVIYEPVYDNLREFKDLGILKIIKVTETDLINRTKKQFDFVDETSKPDEAK